MVETSSQTDPVSMVNKEVDFSKRMKSRSVSFGCTKLVNKGTQTPTINLCTTGTQTEKVVKQTSNEIANVLNESICSVTDDEHDEPFVPEYEEDSSQESGTEEAAEEHKTSLCYTVFWQCLKPLFQICLKCGSVATITKVSTIRTMLTVEHVCIQGHHEKWRSQSMLKKLPEGTLRLAAGILFSGLGFQGTKDLFTIAGIQFFSKTQFFSIQKAILFPAINHVYLTYQDIILERLRSLSNVEVVGDGRCDSLGYSAKYGTYSLMDSTTNQLICFIVVHVANAGNSVAMEKYGLIKTLDSLEETGVNVACLTTDRHISIRKYMREDRSKILHQFDIWHVSKSVKKKLTKAAKKKVCNKLSGWACCTCNRNAQLLKEKWISLVYHVRGIHEWDGCELYRECEHEEYSLAKQMRKKWLENDGPAYNALKNIVLDKQLLKDLPQLRFFKHTGQLEVYHALLNKYCGKRFAYSYAGMVARTQLAVLDHNSGVTKEQACTKDGTLRFKVVFTKVTGNWVAKKVMVTKDKNYQHELMDETIQMAKKEKQPKYFLLPEVPANIATVENPGKDVVISRTTSRFMERKK